MGAEGASGGMVGYNTGKTSLATLVGEGIVVGEGVGVREGMITGLFNAAGGAKSTFIVLRIESAFCLYFCSGVNLFFFA